MAKINVTGRMRSFNPDAEETFYSFYDGDGNLTEYRFVTAETDYLAAPSAVPAPTTAEPGESGLLTTPTMTAAMERWREAPREMSTSMDVSSVRIWV